MEKITIEEWRTIPSHPDYAASSFGRIKRLTSTTVGEPGRIRKLTRCQTGYLYIRLSENGFRKTYLVHLLIAEAFIGPRPTDKDTNHKNGIKTDNRPYNLEYVSRQRNIQHSYEMGLQLRTQNQGQRNGRAKLTDFEVLEIFSERGCSSDAFNDLALKYGVNRSIISRIINGKIWKHLTSGQSNQPKEDSI